MQRKRITNTDVERFPVTDADKAKERATLWDEVRGFGLRYFKNSQTRTYIFQYRVKGSKQQRTITIGRHNDPWRVDQARAKALELKVRMVSGADPVAEAKRKQEEAAAKKKHDAVKAITLREVLKLYTENKKLRSKTKSDLRRHCENNLSEWLDEPVTAITLEGCRAKFAEIKKRGAPIQANQCMRCLRALLNYIRYEKMNPVDGTFPILAVNPVSLLIRQDGFNEEKVRKERIPLNTLGKVWNLLRDTAETAHTDVERSAAAWVATMILTGMRRTESGALKRSNVNLDAKTIMLHGEVEKATDRFEGTKNHNDIELPISSALHEVLDACMKPKEVSAAVLRRRTRQRNTEYVFYSNGQKCPFITNAPKLFDAIGQITGCKISPHSCRRTFVDLCEAVKLSSDQSRHLTNHIAGDCHYRHYGNSRQHFAEAMEKIGNYVTDAARVARAQANGENVLTFPLSA